ncbi:hypothetical protein RE432_14885 [Pusillimonas sp. SM2304]|uniref:hypothetical protein n=1 Tax=Pusillimonas sp. SM2304 TaxID=3073241 RepID=UPI0028761B19|nr:hypothetical protein [Pusillimonas sp. SM2304]MDS1141725.1 hypothetical protein [Pusillimonas sp. SM2304]
MKTTASNLLTAAALAILGAGAPGVNVAMADQPKTQITKRVSKRQMLRQAWGPMLYATRMTSHRTVAQNKRAALKRRSRARAK